MLALSPPGTWEWTGVAALLGGLQVSGHRGAVDYFFHTSGRQVASNISWGMCVVNSSLILFQEMCNV